MNSLDVSKKYINQLRLINGDINNNVIDTFNNNYQIKTTLVNVDSKYRNKLSSNIVNMYTDSLPHNMIETTAHSNIVKLNIIGHNYIIGDQISLQNVRGKKLILSNSIMLVEGIDYFIICINNHNILNSCNINITNYDNIDNIMGNVMINSIIGMHNVELYNPSIHNISNNSIYKMSSRDISMNYLFVKLPYKCTSTIISDNIFQFEFMNIGGIPLQFLNANYPVGNMIQSSHEIIDIDNNSIYINSSCKAITSEIGGGDKITIGKIVNTLEGYPNGSDYTWTLSTTFNNVVQIEIVSSEIPYINININCKNNKLYWQYLEDGNYIYSITIIEGNYNRESLINYLVINMNSIRRINSSYNICFDININSNTSEVIFNAFTYKDDIKEPTSASFLFNYNDTIGNLLGFNECGINTSITPFLHTTSNTNAYIQCNRFTTPNILTFCNNNYMFLYINDYENMLTNPRMMNCFTKILLKENCGEIMFNTFVKYSPMVFLNPVSCISELKIKFMFPDGSLVDFRNLDHSFTLKITEIITQCYDSGLNSRNSNYLETLSKIGKAH